MQSYRTEPDCGLLVTNSAEDSKCQITTECIPEGTAWVGPAAGGAESAKGRGGSSGKGASVACMSSAFGAFLAGHVACMH